MLTCEYCDKKYCDWSIYGDDLEDKLNAVELEEGEMNEKCYRMYRAFTYWKHGQVGRGMQLDIGGCVIDLILSRFPVEAGKRKRGFVLVSSPQE